MKSTVKRPQNYSLRIGALTLFAGFCLAYQAGAQSQNVLTMHNNLARTGADTNETILTSANVNSTDFGKLFTESLDGEVYAQPLYIQNLSISGGTHNVVYVCTESNSVYAFDADSGSQLWYKNLGVPGSSTTIGCSDLTPNIGITGTPVIDLTNNAIYLDSLTIVSGTYTHYLHALNLTNGDDEFGSPKTISASLSGQTFDALIQRQRPGLLLLNGVVYIGFGSYCDDNSYHGWLLGYNENSLSQVSSYIVTPGGSQGALWMSGMAPAADSSGNIYVMTANGTFDANTGGSDYGESFLRFSTSSGLSLSDYFTPTDFSTLNANDTDLGSGGPVLLPGNYVVGVGKDGNMYLCVSTNLGHYSSSGNACKQSFSATAATDTVGPSPVYWVGPGGNQNLFLWSGNNNAVEYRFNGSTVNTTSVASGSVAQSDRVGGIALSANGNTNGILWGDYDGNVLYAYDADNFATVLWNSSQNSSRDSLGSYNKFTSPMIANGKVYMGTAGALVVYGELNANQVAEPSFSPGPGVYSTAQSVTISDSTSGASINYTTDGSTPSSTHGTLYSGPVDISTTTTLQAIGFKTGMTSSAVNSGNYVISSGGAGGSVLLNFNTSGQYTGNFVFPSGVVSCTETNAGGVSGSGAILVTGADGNSTYWPGNWNFSTNTAWVNVSIMGLIKQATGTGDKWQLGIVGTTNTGFAGAATGDGYAFGSFRLVPTSTTSPSYQLVYQTATNGTTSTANVGSAVTLTVGHWYQFNTYFTNTGSGTSFNMASSLIDYGTTGATAGSTIIASSSTLESISGTQATISSYVVYPCFRVADDVGVSVLDNFNVVGIGTNSSSGGSGVAAPSFSPAGGTYTSSQSVTISDSTSGASIKYTVDGSQPTQSNGNSYSSAVSITNTTTLKAIAYLGTTNSTITDETYLFGSPPNLFYEMENLTVATNSFNSGDTVQNYSDPNLSGGQGSFFYASGTSSYVVYVVPNVTAGTNDVRIGLEDNNNEGIFQLLTSATEVGGYFPHGSTVDQYSATNTYPEVDIGNVTFGSSGTKYFMFSVTNIDGSSSGYNLALDYIKVIQVP